MDKRSLDIKLAADVINAAKKEVLEILSGPEHASLSLATGPQLDSIVKRLYFMAGATPEVDQAPVNQFPPITNFMGEEITYPKMVAVEDFEATATEKDVFLDKVDRLYKEFTSIPVDGILNSYTLPEDVLVIRGVAKTAGLEDYQDAEINSAFVEKIAKAIAEKDAETAKQKEIDAQLKSLNQQADGPAADATKPEKTAEVSSEKDAETAKQKDPAKAAKK
jgi:hypothetical protein